MLLFGKRVPRVIAVSFAALHADGWLALGAQRLRWLSALTAVLIFKFHVNLRDNRIKFAGAETLKRYYSKSALIAG
jgi:hypothetical protein